MRRRAGDTATSLRQRCAKYTFSRI